MLMSRITTHQGFEWNSHLKTNHTLIERKLQCIHLFVNKNHNITISIHEVIVDENTLNDNVIFKMTIINFKHHFGGNNLYCYFGRFLQIL